MTSGTLAGHAVVAYGFEEFQQAMARLAPLSPRPQIACAVSGGSDSLALLLLLDRWCRAQGGQVWALSVDHGLRAEAKTEQQLVAALCQARGIGFTALRWTGVKPGGAIQMAARAARYALLEQQCARQGLVYLALAHQVSDQAETFLLRLAAGSGVFGLAGMARQRAREDLCLLRPLLAAPKDRLQAFLRAQGVTWVEDPSNNDPRYDRVRWRQAAEPLRAAGLDGARLSDLTQLYGRLRRQWDRQLAGFFATAVDLRPEGFAWLKDDSFVAAPRLLAEAALTRLLTCVSGAAYPPRQTGVKALLARWCDNKALDRGVTLGGCRLLPRRGGRVLLVREAARVEKTTLRAGEKIHWDGRFSITLEGEISPPPGPEKQAENGVYSISCLGEAGWRTLCARSPDLRGGSVPQAAAVTLPALRYLDSLLVVPHLEYPQGLNTPWVRSCRFRPRQLLAGPAFT